MELRIQTFAACFAETLLRELPIITYGTLRELHDYVRREYPHALWKPSSNIVGGYYIMPTTKDHESFALWIT